MTKPKNKPEAAKKKSTRGQPPKVVSPLAGTAPPGVLAKVSKDSKRKALPAMEQPRLRIEDNRKSLKKVVKVEKKAERAGKLSRWMKLLSDPFGAEVSGCPINYNPVPTLAVTKATTVCSGSSTIIASGQTSLYLYPGHSLNVPDDPMDGPSYHSYIQTINATDYVFGPVDVGATVSCAGVLVTNENSSESNVTTTSNIYSSALVWDKSLPFTGSSDDGGHTRWKLIAMGIRVWNTTPMATRSGTITTIQPSSKVAYSSTKQYSVFPTYNKGEFGDEKTHEVSWIPRLDDLSYWHATPHATTSNAGAGLRVNLFNTSTSVQAFGYEIIAHWEIGGSNLASISQPVVHMPADKNIVEPTLDALSNSTHTARSAPAVASVVAKEVNGTISELASSVGHGLTSLASSAIKSFFA